VNFGIVLLQELEDLMLNVEANWLEVVLLRTIITLVSRLLASAIMPMSSLGYTFCCARLGQSLLDGCTS
jgi:hypothetical protein